MSLFQSYVFVELSLTYIFFFIYKLVSRKFLVTNHRFILAFFVIFCTLPAMTNTKLSNQSSTNLNNDVHLIWGIQKSLYLSFPFWHSGRILWLIRDRLKLQWLFMACISWRVIAKGSIGPMAIQIRIQFLHWRHEGAHCVLMCAFVRL